MKFTELGLNAPLLEALDYMGFEEATPIQEQAIPVILSGKDLIGCAQTGTGKTAAFILPVLNMIADSDDRNTSTLIIVPTRELAIQIDQAIQGFAYFLGITSITIHGGGSGSDWEGQKRALTSGADIIVATPGKLLSHLNMGYVKFKNIKHLILDEADRMLDMGFQDDINRILKYVPKVRQTLLFSATMAPKIRKLAAVILNNPESINIALAKPAEGILQVAYLVHEPQKEMLVQELVKNKDNYKSILIFCSTKKKVSSLFRSMKRNGYNVEKVSSDLEQDEREKVLQGFRSKRIRIIVATDVLSRGIDIADINLVINFDVPKDPADYVHRIGRTARADTEGVAITLISSFDIPNFKNIEGLIGREIYKTPLPQIFDKGPDYNSTSRPRASGNNRNSSQIKKRNFGRGPSNDKKRRNPRADKPAQS